jgi:hypothetical protein
MKYKCECCWLSFEYDFLRSVGEKFVCDDCVVECEWDLA